MTATLAPLFEVRAMFRRFAFWVFAALICGCGGHTDQIALEIQQSTGDRGFARGERRELSVSVFGGGDRLNHSFYSGPVDVTFAAAKGIDVQPGSIVITMSAKNGYDRSRSSGTVTVTVSDDAPLGECLLDVAAKTRSGTSARATFQFTVIDSR